jgi:hypothetical protein
MIYVCWDVLHSVFGKVNDAPRRKQRGILGNYFSFAASGGELTL